MAKTKTDPKNTAILVGGGLLLFFYNDIFGKSSEEKEGENLQTQMENLPFDKNPFNYEAFLSNLKKNYPIKSGYVRLTLFVSKGVVDVKKLATAERKLYTAIGYVVYNTSDIISVFQNCLTRLDVAILAKGYSKMYGKDLYNNMKSRMTDYDLGRVLKFVNKLPNYASGVTGVK